MNHEDLGQRPQVKLLVCLVGGVWVGKGVMDGPRCGGAPRGSSAGRTLLGTARARGRACAQSMPQRDLCTPEHAACTLSSTSCPLHPIAPSGGRPASGDGLQRGALTRLGCLQGRAMLLLLETECL